MSFYQTIAKTDTKKTTLYAKAVSGGAAGEKIFLSGGEILICEPAEGFLAAHKEEILSVPKTGLVTIEGTDVFVEYLQRGKKLVLCGAGYVSLYVLKIAKMTGFTVTVIDDRPAFLDMAQEAGADEVLGGDMIEALAQIPGDAETFFVIAARNHKLGDDCLRAIAAKPSAYVGMLGSRKRAEALKEKLAGEGVSEEWLEQIYLPIGLRIAAESPEEIAVSIVAEIIQVKNRSGAAEGFSDEMMSALLTADRSPYVLATLIKREGSAPRNPGVKMLIREKGTIGTIGGGTAEWDVIQRARKLPAEAFPLVIETGEAETGGGDEVCGGKLTVYLELV